MPCDTCCIACKLPFYYMSFNRNMKLYKQTKKQKKKLLQTEKKENVLRMIFKIDLKLFVLESSKCLRFKVRSFFYLFIIFFFICR